MSVKCIYNKIIFYLLEYIILYMIWLTIYLLIMEFATTSEF